MKNNNQLHLVLGGTGAIGQAVIKELQKRNLPLKAINRSKKIEGIETINIDLMNKEKTQKAIPGASHVYLCIGLPYNSKIWKTQWPIIVENVIDACSLAKAKLIFLDNIYMYGPAPLGIPFDESESQDPQTRKGKVRKKIADMILEAHKTNKIQAVIGRSADFYGPNAKNSSLYIGFLQGILKGKNPQWLNKPDQEHTYAFTTDIGRALVELALDESTYGEVWHLPVGGKITIEEILKITNKELGTNYKISYMPGSLMAILSLFIPIVREVKEMSYQFDNTYDMSYMKFQKRFPDFKVTDYTKGIQEMIKSFSE
jgi:nucleoside-diphosphate-sugar epimerase